MPDFHIETDRTAGTPILGLVTEGKIQLTASRINALADAGKLARAIPPADLVVILGIGSFALLKELLDRPDHQRFVFALDAAIEEGLVLQTALEYAGDRLRHQLIRVNGPSCSPGLATFYDPLFCATISVFKSPAYLLYEKAGLSRMEGNIGAALEHIGSEFVTQAHFGKIWCRNILSNTLNLLARPGRIQAPPDAKRPWVVLGAGLGLETQLPAIRQLLAADPAASLLCADTAVRFVARELPGTPAWSMTIDPQQVSLSHFHGIPPARHLGDLGINPALFRHQHTIPLLGPHPLARFLWGQSPQPWRLDAPGGNVGHSMVAFLLEHGATSITVFGVDFETINARNHVRASLSWDMANLGQTRLQPLEHRLYAGPATASRTWQSDLLQRYAREFAQAFGENPRVTRIRWDNTGCMAATDSRSRPLPAVPLAPDLAAPQVLASARILYQTLAGWGKDKPDTSSQASVLAALGPELYGALYPVMACFCRNNLKSGHDLTDSRTMAISETVSYVSRLLEPFLRVEWC